MIKMFSYHQQNYMKFKIYYIQVVLILKLFLMPLLKILTLLLSILFLQENKALKPCVEQKQKKKN